MQENIEKEIPKCHRCKKSGVILALASSFLWDFIKPVCQNCFIRHCHNAGVLPTRDHDENVQISNKGYWVAPAYKYEPKVDPLRFNKTFDSRDVNRIKEKCAIFGFSTEEFERMYRGNYAQQYDLRDYVREASRSFKRKGIDDSGFYQAWLSDYDIYNDKTKKISDLDFSY